MMPRPPRTASGRRVYGEPETQTLSFIRRARELGFTLDEIRDFSRFPPNKGNKCAPKSVSLRRTTLGMFGQRLPTSERWNAFSPMLSAVATKAIQPNAR